MEWSTAQRMTVDDLAALPDKEGYHYELIDGELHVSKSPRTEHQTTRNWVATLLTVWNAEAGLGEVVPEPGVILSRHDAVEPDLVWMSLERRATIEGDDGHLHGAPELVVEVLSPGASNERRDRETKLALYEREGVSDYWIFDWRAQTIDVYRREADALYIFASLHAGDTLSSPLLPGFSAGVTRFFTRS
jgi:Uma2 family endonuclease